MRVCGNDGDVPFARAAFWMESPRKLQPRSLLHLSASNESVD